MKIGLSYSRCVRDIVDGNVNINHVLVVISRTDFDPHNDEQWASIWEGYGGGQNLGSIWSRPEWGGYPAEDEQRFRDVSKQLWDQGLLHQPRKFGAHPPRMPYHWLETVLPNSELDKHPSVKEAWDNFQILAGLTSTQPNRDHFA